MNKGYYVVMCDDIIVVGPRKIGFDALKHDETFMVGPYELKENAQREADKQRALARTGQK